MEEKQWASCVLSEGWERPGVQKAARARGKRQLAHSLERLQGCAVCIHSLQYQLPYAGLPWWLRRQRIWLQGRRPGFHPSVGKIPWRREWQPTPVFLPGEFHGERNLVGYSPWDHKELNMTEWRLCVCVCVCVCVHVCSTLSRWEV